MKKPNLVSCLSAVVAVVVGGQTFLGGPSCALASDLVNVQAKDGRVFSGKVDTRTSDEFLDVAFDVSVSGYADRYSMSAIARVCHADREFTAAEFRLISENLKSDLPSDFFTATAADRIESEAAANGLPWRSSQVVTSIRIEANAVDWDADVELDGLELRVVPLAADGTVVPVAGVIRARLVAPNYDPYTRAFPEIGRWNQTVRVVDHDDLWGALYRLPFRTVNPEFDLRFGSYGILDVQLDVRGNGTLAASQQVRVRTPSSVRDQLQLLEHRRFFKHERASWRDR